MSLSSLADQEIIRKEAAVLESRMKPQVSAVAAEMLHPLGIDPAKQELLTGSIMPLAVQTPVEPTNGSKALDSLARYIPTEAITLYVAACSAMTALKGKISPETPQWAYWIFVGLTPCLFFIIFVGKRASANLPALPSVTKWPWWKLFASTVAFAVWALAVPGGPYLTGEVGGILAAFLAVFISTFLTLLEPIFEKKTQPAPSP